MSATPETDQVTAEIPVIFRDREIYARMPSPEQMLVWQRILDRLTNAPPDESWTGSQVMASLERLRKIVDSIIVNNVDIEWIDDMFLSRELTFQDLAPFITLVVEQFAERAGNRSERRSVKKAIRKADR